MNMKRVLLGALVILGWVLGPSWAFSTGQMHSTAVLTHHFRKPPVSLAMSTNPSGRFWKHANLGRSAGTWVGLSTYPASIGRAPPLAVRVKDLAASAISKLRKNVDEVSMWRVAAVTFISCIFLFQSTLDAGFINLWSFLQHSPGLIARAFRHDHWEWMVAISAFIVWIHGFGLADKLVKRAARQGRVHPWRKYRLQDRYEADKFRREMIRRKQRGEDVDLNAQPPLVTEQSEWNWKGWICELPVYALPLFIWDYLIPRRAAKIAAWGAPTTLQVCRDVTCGLLLYDAMFFVGHFLMHKIPFIYKTVHKKHHINTEARAMEIVRLSIPEEVLEVGISIIALNYLQCHPVSRTIYNLIITFLLTELHCGFDFPWTPQNVVPFGFATGSRRHHYHHRYGKHYYQKFFCHVDRLFGCFQKNDGTLMGDSVQRCKEIPSTWQSTTKQGASS